MKKLKCQICGKLVDNVLPLLTEHIETHIGNYKEEAKIAGQDIDQWILSYFDSIEPTIRINGAKTLMRYVDIEITAKVRVPFNCCDDVNQVIADIVVEEDDEIDAVVIRRINGDADLGIGGEYMRFLNQWDIKYLDERNGGRNMRKPNYVVYEIASSDLRAQFEAYIKKQTGVDVKLTINYDEETMDLMVYIDNDTLVDMSDEDINKIFGDDRLLVHVDKWYENAAMILTILYPDAITCIQDLEKTNNNFFMIDILVPFNVYMKQLLMSEEQIEEIAQGCINNMGDIFYDPSDLGDEEWGLGDDGKPEYPGERATERLLNYAALCVVDTIRNALGIETTDA